MPAAIVVDANVLIDARKYRGSAGVWLSGELPASQRLALSAIIVAECFAGIESCARSGCTNGQRAFRACICVHRDRNPGREHPLRVSAPGRIIALADAPSAATASQHAATFVTSHSADCTIGGLTVVRPNERGRGLMAGWLTR